jgi:hypothetical protein
MRTLEERFWRKVQRGERNQCWLWLGSRAGKGYGQIWHKNRWQRAHRVSWMFYHGSEPPPDLCVCHSCDTPACVNPRHLWLGTLKDNAQDALAKGRLKYPKWTRWTHPHSRKTHCPRGHPYAGKNLLIDHRGARVCRFCEYITNRRGVARKDHSLNLTFEETVDWARARARSWPYGEMR